jgi:hypothetical protein
MNDIEKMRQEFEQKVKYAQIENEMNEKLKGDSVEMHIYGNSFGKNKDKLHVGFWGVNEKNWNNDLNPRQIGAIMTNFPVTEQVQVESVQQGTIAQVDYKMHTERSLHMNYTQLNIDWISGEYDIRVSMKIDSFLKDEDLMQWFTITYRDVDSDWEGPKNRWNYDARHFFKYYTFKQGKIVKFRGGYDYQCDPSVSNGIAEMFKYRYEFS